MLSNIEDSRTDFNKCWLAEMPQRLNSSDAYNYIVDNIKTKIKNNSTVIQLKNNLYKISSNQIMYYWYEKDQHIELGVEISIQRQGLMINLLGKDLKLKGKTPFASDLYAEIINDTNHALILFSDFYLSDESYAVWNRLFDRGFNIGIYNRQKPGESFKVFKNKSEMKNYFSDNKESSNYQYVILPHGEVLSEVVCIFNTRRYRELSGIL